MSAQHSNEPQKANSNFIKAMIKIANPTWTPEQVDAELQKKLLEMQNPENSEGCEFCSS